jgi:hypothetical protein
LRALAEAGWLVETEGGWVVDRDRIDPELRQFTRESARRFLVAARDVSAVLCDAGLATPTADRAAG